MRLRDWWDRLNGRTPEPAVPEVVLDRVPTEQDLLAALESVDASVAGGLVPAPVTSRVRRITRTVRETLPRVRNLGLGSAEDPADRLAFVQTAPALSPEVLLAQACAALELHRPDLVAQAVETMLRADPCEWRAVWMSGLAALEAGSFAAARSAFDAVFGQVPGELAPQLALALACERGGEPDVAEGLYATCASTHADDGAAGAFGLARLRSARGDVAGILERALALAQGSAPRSTPGPAPQGLTVRPYAAQPDVLRDGLEATYRELARSEDDEARSHAWADRANAVRRWTLR